MWKYLNEMKLNIDEKEWKSGEKKFARKIEESKTWIAVWSCYTKILYIYIYIYSWNLTLKVPLNYKKLYRKRRVVSQYITNYKKKD